MWANRAVGYQYMYDIDRMGFTGANGEWFDIYDANPDTNWQPRITKDRILLDGVNPKPGNEMFFRTFTVATAQGRPEPSMHQRAILHRVISTCLPGMPFFNSQIPPVHHGPPCLVKRCVAVLDSPISGASLPLP